MNMFLGDTQSIIAEALKHNMLRNQLAYVLATANWETAGTMKPVREAYYLGEASGKAEKFRKTLRYYPYYGRGYPQLTWKDNYAKAGKELGVGDMFVTSPDLVMEKVNAIPIMIRGMLEGWFTGKKLSDYITLKKSDFVGARKIINGTDKASQIAQLANNYNSELIKMGYGTDPSPMALLATHAVANMDSISEAPRTVWSRIKSWFA